MRHYPVREPMEGYVRCPKCKGTGRQQKRRRPGFYGDNTMMCTRCWGLGCIKDNIKPEKNIKKELS
jgi:DnaJ-class molecular chaperone